MSQLSLSSFDISRRIDLAVSMPQVDSFVIKTLDSSTCKNIEMNAWVFRMTLFFEMSHFIFHPCEHLHIASRIALGVFSLPQNRTPFIGIC